jgi:putative endonuclease
MNKKEIGFLAEELVRSYLLKSKYKILERNYRTKFGEIDIIAYDRIDDAIVFIEVRYRSDSSYGSPQETVNYYKQLKIINSALVYIKNKNLKEVNYRFDIISVTRDNKIEHIKNAFVPSNKLIYF